MLVLKKSFVLSSSSLIELIIIKFLKTIKQIFDIKCKQDPKNITTQRLLSLALILCFVIQDVFKIRGQNIKDLKTALLNIFNLKIRFHSKDMIIAPNSKFNAISCLNMKTFRACGKSSYKFY